MPSKIDRTAAVSAAGFVAVLALAAYWDRSIRVLHAFESLPYVAAAALIWRRSKPGYAVGFVSGAFWLWMGGFLTTFVRNGFERAGMLVRTGTVDRPDILIAAPAAVFTAGLAVLSLVGYARRDDKSWADLVRFAVAAVAVPAFFVAIFWLFKPEYLQMFRSARM